MKRTFILLLALVAAVTSGVAVFHQLSVQIATIPEESMTGDSSEDALAYVIASSAISDESATSAMSGAPEDITTQTATSENGIIATNSASSLAASLSPAVYAAYTKGVVGNGQTSVLFFASSSQESTDAAGILKALYKLGSARISTYQADYETEKDLKKTYGVLRPATFVLIDETGKALKTIESPSEETLTKLVQG